MDHKNASRISQGGIKRDSNKPRIELISAIATIKKARVYTFGAETYGTDNWRKGIAWCRIIGALLRHTFAYLGGETNDPETGLSHMAHAACCVDFLLEYEETHPELDDRYKPIQLGTAEARKTAGLKDHVCESYSIGGYCVDCGKQGLR